MTAPTHTGGGICPLCTWAQDNGHPCITNPTAQAVLDHVIAIRHRIPLDVIDALDAHPARPIHNPPTLTTWPLLRPVDRTWCNCQCSPTPSTPQPGAARS